MKNRKVILRISWVVIIILSIVGIQTYAQRGLQARVRDAASFMSAKTNQLGSTLQYEPYYLTSNYQVDRFEDETQVLLDKSQASAGQRASGSLDREQKSEYKISVVRKLIKRAEINLKVKKCRETLENIKQISNAVSGIVIEASVQSYTNVSESGKAVLKVDPTNFDFVLTKIKELGHLDNEHISGDDVTEEYVDLTSRLTNLEHVKDRLLKILEVNAGKIKDILEVEREINRVGEQIEQIQGRMKLIDNQVSLSTITINFYEEKPISSNSFHVTGQIKETFRAGIEIALNIFNVFILLLAILVPTLIWISFISVFIYMIVRFIRHKKKL